MTITNKMITGGVLFAAVLIFLCQCKSPEQQQEAVVTPAMDTATAVDTTQIAAPIATDTSSKPAPLTLLITNLTSPTAPVIVGVYNPKNKFPDPKDQMKIYTFTPESISLTAHITDLPFGTYALAIYQDVNSNGKIDKNLIGIPTEPYAFSNNYKPTIKAPAFKNCQFEYSASNNSVPMKMIK